jgi:hypothetical protein
MYNFSPHELAAIEQMKAMPPQQQQEYLNSKMGQMPIWQLMAMQGEVRRQQDMKAALPQQQIPNTTVAQDLQGTLSQGIASQPVRNIGNPQAYAGGGIVAFDDGGEVQHFAVGGIDRRTGRPLNPVVPEEWTPEDESTYKELESLHDEALRTPSGWWTGEGEGQRIAAAQQQWREGNKPQQYEELLAKWNRLNRKNPAAVTPKKEQGGEGDVAPDYAGLAALGGPRGASGVRGGFAMPSMPAMPDVTAPDREYQTGLKKDITAEEAKLGTDDDKYIEKQAALRAAREEKAGIGQAAIKQTERVERMEKNIPSSQRGMWLALAKTGFKIAATPGLAKAIGEGSQEGIDFYLKFDEHRRDLQEKADTARFQLEASQEAVKAGRLTAAEADLKEQKSYVRGLKDKLSASELAMKRLEATEAGDTARTLMQIRGSFAIAAAQAKSKNELYDTLNYYARIRDTHPNPAVRAAADAEYKLGLQTMRDMDRAQAEGDIAKAQSMYPGFGGMGGGNMPGGPGWGIQKNK